MGTLLPARHRLLSAARFLAEAAGEGGALEFGIGTGRLALPLSRRGVDVQGIAISDDMIGLDVLDIATQTGTSHHFFIDQDRVATFDTPYRYVWPSELDLMAQLAGMMLDQRWSDWDRSPFTGESRKHASVYRSPAFPGMACDEAYVRSGE